MALDLTIDNGNQSHGSWLDKSSDLILALLVIAIIALMILPLPLFLLDALLAINIALGVVLVLMGIYVSSPLQFSVFPSVLLISTLFRLALSVATTRMILLTGEAGNIIDTFGQLVAGGSLVVGLVIFLIITLVQFLVIAKGAERVAEVGARFTLDAMPGKQMSIDSDLRSGLIDKVEARRRRQEVELEAKLHGSMDGAMKFVKGDAIAGIVIIFVNLLGGLSIGVFQLEMDPSSAMARYSILTIGDGMVAQIPALFGAMSAGLIVTRVTAENSQEHLGSSMKRQFSSIPRVLLVAGGICILFALIPGFPTITFILLGGLMLLAGVMLVPALHKRLGRVTEPAFQVVLNNAMMRERFPQQDIGVDSLITGTEDVDEVEHAIPLLLELPASLSSDGGDTVLRDRLGTVIDSYQKQSGVKIPRLQFNWSKNGVDEWSLFTFEVPVAGGRFSATSMRSAASTDELVKAIENALRSHAYLFMGIQETSAMLTLASEGYPDIVKEALRGVPIHKMSAIFRNLVREDVSIRNLRGILEALVDASQQEKDSTVLTEFARIALSRELSHRYCADGILRAVSLSTMLEQLITKALREGGAGRQGCLPPLTAQKISTALIRAIAQYKPHAIVTPVQIRKYCRDLLVAQDIETPVLSYNELVPSIELQVLERVEANASPSTTQDDEKKAE